MNLVTDKTKIPYGAIKKRTSDEKTLVEEYFELQEKYEKKYGEKSVILVQVGSFYEIYEYNETEDKTPHPKKPRGSIGKASEMAFTLNRKLTRKDTNKPYSVRNCAMMGFPTVAYDDYRDKILKSGFTIIRIDQEKNGEVVMRMIGEIVSPATNLEEISTLPTTNNIVCVYIEGQMGGGKNVERLKPEQYIIICGIASIDVSTGKNIVAEVYSKEQDQIYAIQELYRFLTVTAPRELVIVISKIPGQDRYERYLEEVLELNRYNNVIFTGIENPEYIKVDYQEQFLNKIFKPVCAGTDKIMEQKQDILGYLNLTQLYYGVISYLSLLQFCYSHDETIINKIAKPETTWLDIDKHLILTHNAILQLNVLPPATSGRGTKTERKQKTYDSLFAVVDETSTALGKRYLRNMLLNPINDVEQLEWYYNITEQFLANGALVENINNQLHGFPDLERYQRKLFLTTIKPREFCLLFTSFRKVVDTYVLLLNNKLEQADALLLTEEEIEEFNECLSKVFTLIDLNKLEECRILNDHLEFEESFLQPGQDELADEYNNEIGGLEAKMKEICAHLNKLLPTNRGKVLEFNFNVKNSTRATASDDDESAGGIVGGWLSVTNAKAKTLKDQKKLIDSNLCGNLEFKSGKSKTIITSRVIEEICDKLEETRKALEEHLLKRYKALISELNEYNFYTGLVRFISLLDYIKSNAIVAKKYHYFKPIIDHEAKSSYFEIKDLRHPIAERLINDNYITNDITLGKDSGPYGQIVLGLNGVGKTVYTKGVGDITLMAHMGMYTSCQYKFFPFAKIITRLSTHDDMSKAQSSFVVEMEELRTILRNSDNRTLVLGDELCRGTEIYSASSLMISTILELIERKTCFIFSSHLHNITSNPEITALVASNLLLINHLSTLYDPTSSSLIYERKLKDGSGSTLYGIEVAKYLDLPGKFIERSNEIRKKLLNSNPQILQSKKSRYNSKVYVDSCSMCGSTKDLHTHHLLEQADAVNGFVDNTPIHSKYNLLVLCQKCHQWVHHNNLSIIRNQTPQGTIITTASSASSTSLSEFVV